MSERRRLPSFNPWDSFLNRIENQFGRLKDIPPEILEIMQNPDLYHSHKAEVFRQLTSGRGIPSTHCSHQLSPLHGHNYDGKKKFS